MNTDRLTSAVQKFEQMQEQRQNAERERNARRMENFLVETMAGFRKTLSTESREMLAEAGFSWKATGFGLMKLTRVGSDKSMLFRLTPKGIAWVQGDYRRTYKTSSPEGELDLLSEIAFQFGV